MFSEKSQLPIDIDDYVFTTEAHLLPVSLSVTQTPIQPNVTVIKRAAHTVHPAERYKLADDMLAKYLCTCTSGGGPCFSRWQSVYALLSEHRDVVPQQPLVCQDHQGRLQVPHWGGTGLQLFTCQVGLVLKDMLKITALLKAWFVTNLAFYASQGNRTSAPWKQHGVCGVSEEHGHLAHLSERDDCRRGQKSKGAFRDLFSLYTIQDLSQTSFLPVLTITVWHKRTRDMKFIIGGHNLLSSGIIAKFNWINIRTS